MAQNVVKSLAQNIVQSCYYSWSERLCMVKGLVPISMFFVCLFFASLREAQHKNVSSWFICQGISHLKFINSDKINEAFLRFMTFAYRLQWITNDVLQKPNLESDVILQRMRFTCKCGRRVNKTYKPKFCRELAGECMGKNNWIITSLVKFQAQKRGKGLCLQVALQHRKSQNVWEMKVKFVYA